MAATVEEFKRAFSVTLAERLDDQAVEAALKQLRASVGSLDQAAATTEGFRSALIELVKRFSLVNSQNGRTRPERQQELGHIHRDTLDQINLVQGSPPAFGSPLSPQVNGGAKAKADGFHGAPPPPPNAGGGPAPGNAPPPVANTPPAKPGASSDDLMSGLDPDAIRIINAETDRIFYEHRKIPKGTKILPNSPEAEFWLAIRDGVAKNFSVAYTEPSPAMLVELHADQRTKHGDKVDEFLTFLKLSNTQVDELTAFANAVPANERAEKLLEALSDNNKQLGKLSKEAKKGLVALFALNWLYSPGNKEDGAIEDLKTVTDRLKGDIKAALLKGVKETGNLKGARETARFKEANDTAEIAADALRFVMRSVPYDEFAGSSDVIDGELMIQQALWDASVDLDPMGTTQGYKSGYQLALRLLGHKKLRYFQGSTVTGTQVRSEDQPEVTEERRNAIMVAVAHGALSDKETDVFFDMMFNWTSDYDVSPRDSLFGTLFDVDPTTVPQQESMAKLLSRIVNRAHAKNEKDAEFNDANLMEIMKSKGGREVLFSTSMPDDYRKWALDMMAQNSDVPGKQPWTAKDLEKGWESPVVVEAYATAAVKQAQASFAQPWKVDATRDRGALINSIGQLMLPDRKPDNLPKNETADQKKKRLEEGFNHPLYDQDKKPFKKILEHIGPGNVMVTGIPVTVMNRQEGAALFQVLRVQKDEKSPVFFIDHEGNKYDAVETWKKKNELPPGAMTYPMELTLGNPLETERTPKDAPGSRIAAEADKAAMAAGAVAGVALLVGTGGLAAPLVAGTVAVYTSVRTVQKLSDMHDRGYDVTDLGDSDVRGAYLDLASNAFGAGAMGSAKLIGLMTKQGVKMSRAGATLIAGMTWAGNIADAASLAHQIDQLAEKWGTMDDGQKAEALMSLGFTGAMQGKQLKQGGFRGQFDYTRIRNQLEYGTPFSVVKARPEDKLEPGESVAVRNDNGKMTIIYKDAYPSKEMLALHSDAAVSMEASYALKEKLKQMMGITDPKKALEPPRGSAAWEAHHELKKIDAELELNLKKMKNADEKTRQELVARQIELNAAIVKQKARLDYWDQAGRGLVAAPATATKQVEMLGWEPELRTNPNLKKLKDEGYEWVAGKIEPYLYAPGKEKLYYSRTRKAFITETERATIEAIAERASEDWFEKTFRDANLGQKPKETYKRGEVDRANEQVKREFERDPDGKVVKIEHKDGGMPNVLKVGMHPDDYADALSKALGIKIQQLYRLLETMGKQVSKEFLAAWSRSAARSEVAVESLKKIKTYENRASELERSSADKREQGDTKGANTDQKYAEGLRESARKLKGKAYDPVRKNFWDEVYKDKKLRAKIEAMGLTFDGNAPYLKVPDPDKPGKFIEMQVTLEHAERKTDVPSKAQDPDNLLFSFRHENTVLLEKIRKIIRWRTTDPKRPTITEPKKGKK